MNFGDNESDQPIKTTRIAFGRHGIYRVIWFVSVQIVAVRSRRALVMTKTLLRLIAAAAKIGVTCQFEPRTGTRMPAARGMPRTL